MSNNMFKLSKQAMIKIGILSLTLSIFILDLQIPLGVAIGELYSIIILLTIFVKNKKSTVVLSTVLTIIIILGYYLSPEGGELWKIIFNRIFSILLIWIIGGVILKRKSLEFSNDTLLKTLHDERNMFLGGPVVIFKWQNKEGWPIEYVSKNVETILGYTDKEFLNENLNYADLIVKKYQSIVTQEVSDAISMKTENFTHTPYEIQKKNGETLYISDHTTLLYDENGTITHFLGFIIDVTKDIQNELLMAENELKFRTLADYTSDWEYWLKPDGHFKYVSPSCMNISGYSKDEFMANAQLFFSIIHPDFKESVSEHHKYRQNEEEDEEEDEDYSSMEFIIISKDGKNKWIEHACVPIYSEEGEYLGRRGTNRDITNRKTYEAELKKFNTLVEQSPFSIVMTDLKGKIEYVNPHFEGVTGYSYQKALGENVRILKSGNTDPKIYQQLWEELNKGNTWKGEFENKDINGNSYWESVSITPLKNLHGEIYQYMAIKENITEKKQIQEQLFQSQKMEAIGQFAGGIAHDFNNILTAILGFSEIGLMDNKDDMILTNIQSSSNRAANLVKKLLGFSRKQIMDPVILDIRQVINDLEKMMNRMIGDNIKIMKSYKDNIPLIFADPGQIEQILVNMIVNARDAINSKEGENPVKLITINLCKTKIIEETKKLNISPGSYIVISVSDTGTGMDKEVQKKIFEPFYTTKEEGKGTGLGLATVFGILKQNKGHIRVYSEPGIGTTFNIYWPVFENPNEFVSNTEEPETSIAGEEFIVLVEDDKDIIFMVESGLKKLGYSILAYSDPMIALEEIPKIETPIDLLITDVIMPHMDGKTFTDKLSKVKPGLNILFSSGYTDEHIVNAGILKKEVNFISKPYNLVLLTQKIKEITENSTPDKNTK